jgi:hypothetical protein
MRFPKLLATVAASAMMCTGAVLAQQQDQQQPQVAQQCLDNLTAFGQRMQEEGYWLTGWGPGVGVPPDTLPRPGEPGAATVPPEGQAIPDATTPGAAGIGPWGQTLWGVHAPSYQIRTLHAGAHVLAVRGDEQGCQAVLSELTNLYEEHVQQLQEAGIEPGQVTDWRQEMLLAAQPVGELDWTTINVADVTGSDIRNLQDEHLGDIDTVLLASDGTILYVIVSRGGFLGIGADHTLVPWQALKATPGLNTFLLDVPEEVMQQAPEVDPDRIRQPEVFAQHREQIDQYWQQHIGG